MAMANEYNTIFLYPCSIKREKLIDVFHVQMLDNKGVKYRRTAYLSDECNVSPQSIMRVRRMLPKRSIQAVSSNQVEKLINKYTLDIAKG